LIIKSIRTTRVLAAANFCTWNVALVAPGTPERATAAVPAFTHLPSFVPVAGQTDKSALYCKLLGQLMENVIVCPAVYPVDNVCTKANIETRSPHIKQEPSKLVEEAAKVPPPPVAAVWS